MKTGLWEVLTWVFILAVIFLLVRPSSLGPDVVSELGTALTNVIAFAVSS